jgi:hypothetical protein
MALVDGPDCTMKVTIGLSCFPVLAFVFPRKDDKESCIFVTKVTKIAGNTTEILRLLGDYGT